MQDVKKACFLWWLDVEYHCQEVDGKQPLAGILKTEQATRAIPQEKNALMGLFADPITEDRNWKGCALVRTQKSYKAEGGLSC